MKCHVTCQLLVVLLVSAISTTAGAGTRTLTIQPPTDSRISTVDTLTIPSASPRMVYSVADQDTQIVVGLQSASDTVSFTLLTSTTVEGSDATLWPWCTNDLSTSLGTASGLTTTIVVSASSLSSLGLVQGKTYKLCTSEGFETDTMLHYLATVSVSDSTNYGSSSAGIPVPATSGQLTAWSTVVQLAPLTDSTIESVGCYFVPSTADCNLGNLVKAASSAKLALGGITLYSSDFEAMLVAGQSSVRLCFGSTTAVGTKFHLLSNVMAGTDPGVALSSTVIQPLPVHTNIAARMSFKATRSSTSATTLGSFSACRGAGNTTAMASTEATVGTMSTDTSSSISITTSFDLTDHLANTNYGLCWTLPVLGITVYTRVQVEPFYLSKLDGVTDTSLTTDRVLRIVSSRSTEAGSSAKTWQVSVSQGTSPTTASIFLGGSSCRTSTQQAGTSSASFPSGTTLTIPSDWYASGVDQINMCLNTTMISYRLGAYVLQVVQANDVVVTAQAGGKLSNDPTLFLLNGLDVQLTIQGSFFATSSGNYVLGMEVNSACVFTSSITGDTTYGFKTTVLVSRFTASSGTLCIAGSSYVLAPESSSYVRVKAFQTESLISLGLNNVPTLVASTASNTTMTSTFSLNNATQLGTVKFLLGATASSCTAASSAFISFNGDYSFASAFASTAAQHALCWGFTTSAMRVVKVVTVFPTITPTNNQFSALQQDMSVAGASATLKYPVAWDTALTAASAGKTAWYLSIIQENVTGVSVPCSTVGTVAVDGTYGATITPTTAGVNWDQTFLAPPTAAANTPATYHLCAALATKSTGALLHQWHIGYIQYLKPQFASLALPATTTTTYPVNLGLVTEAVDLAMTPTLPSWTDVLALGTAATSTGCSSLTGGNLANLTVDAVTGIPTTLDVNTGDFTSSLAVVLCYHFDSDTANRFKPLNLQLIGTRVTTLDAEAVTFTPATTGTTLSSATQLFSVMSGATRNIKIVGQGLDVPVSYSLLMYFDLTATCASSPDLILTFTVSSATTATASVPASTSGEYLRACFAFSFGSSGNSSFAVSQVVLKVLPITALERVKADGSQNLGLVGIQGISRAIPLLLESPAPSSISTKFFITDATLCSTASSDQQLPLAMTGLAFLTFDATSYSGGQYRLCVTHLIGAGTNRRQSNSSTSITLQGDLGVTASVVTMKVMQYSLNSGGVIGTTLGVGLTLLVTGTSLSYATLYFSAIESTHSCSGTLTGSTVYGNSRVPTVASGCGATSRCTLPAGTNLTGNDTMKICMAVASALDDTPSGASMNVFDTGIKMAIVEPTEIVVLREPSNRTNSINGLDQQPELGLRNAATGALLFTLPVSLNLTATWLAVDPIEYDTAVNYTLDGAVGATSMDFDTAPISHYNAIHGVAYVLTFSVPGLDSVNSTVVTKGDCSSILETPIAYTTKCAACPADAQCDGSLAGLRVSNKNSVWRPNNLSLSIYSCESPYGASQCQKNTSTGTCDEGHTGPRCSVCEPGYGKTFNQCILCEGFVVSLIIVIVAVLFVIVVVAILILTTLQCKKSDQFPIYIKVLLNHLVVTSSIGEFTTYIPRAVSDTFGIFKQTSRPSSEFSSFTCLTGMTWYHQFILINLIPVLAALCVLLGVMLKKKKEDNKRIHKAKAQKELLKLKTTLAAHKRAKSDVLSGGTDDDPLGLKPAKYKAGVNALGTSDFGQLEQTQLFYDPDGPDVMMVQSISTMDPHAPHGSDDDGQLGTSDVSKVRFPNTVAPTANEPADDESDEEVPRIHLGQSTSIRQDAMDAEDAEEEQLMAEIARKESENLGFFQTSELASRQARSHTFSVIMVVILFFTYPSLVEWNANVLKCDDIDFSTFDAQTSAEAPDLRSYFYYDRSSLCTSAEHIDYLIAGVILGLFWGFGTPILCCVLFSRFKRSKKRGGMGRVAASRMFTFLVAGYRAEYWWWEAPMMLRKLCFIWIVSFIKDATLQTLVAFWVVAIHLAFHVTLKPYEYQIIDDMEKASLVVICITLNFTLLYQWVPLDSPDLWRVVIGWILTVFLMIINVCVMLWFVFIIISDGWLRIRKHIRTQKTNIEESTSIPECMKGCILRAAWVPDQVTTVDMKGNEVVIAGEDLPEDYVDEVMQAESDDVSDWSDLEEEDDDDEEEEKAKQDAETKAAGDATLAAAAAAVVAADKQQDDEDEDGDSDMDLDFDDEVLAASMQYEGALEVSETSMTGVQGGPRVVALRAVIAGLKSHSAGLMTRFSETNEKLAYNDRVLEVYKKQLFQAQEQCMKLEDESDARFKDMQEMQGAMRDLELENEELKKFGGVSPSAQIHEKEVRQERDELRKKLAEEQMAGNRPIAKPGSVPHETGGTRPGSALARTGTLTRLTSTQAMQRLDQRRLGQHIHLDPKSTSKALRDIQTKSQAEQGLRVGLLNMEHQAQDDAIREAVARKREERKEKKKLGRDPDAGLAQSQRLGGGLNRTATIRMPSGEKKMELVGKDGRTFVMKSNVPKKTRDAEDDEQGKHLARGTSQHFSFRGKVNNVMLAMRATRKQGK